MQTGSPFRRAGPFLWILLLLLLLIGPADARAEGGNYRDLMRRFVISISEYAKARDPDFIVIPQNGHQLMHDEEDRPLAGYIDAVDGAGQEDLFYGYRGDNRPSPRRETEYLRAFLDTARDHGVTVLVTDYCSSRDRVDDSYGKNRDLGYVSFAAPRRELDVIPDYPAPLPGENGGDVERLSEVRNFLYLINPHRWKMRERYIADLAGTPYDLLIIDAFFEDEDGRTAMLTRGEVSTLQRKPSGRRRLVVAYMSIGEAEDYRYYWREEWDDDPPPWLEEENPRWRGNYLVRYWDPSWQRIIMGSRDSYLDRIAAAGFDGVYLDLVAAFEDFEE